MNKINKDTLGDRMKKYEKVFAHNLTPNSPLLIRVDGKAFHTFTRGAEKPFDSVIIDCMAYATQETAKVMSGFKLAYVQSDEATFLLTDYDTHETQGWYDYELNKVVSITASAFTAHFNRKYESLMGVVSRPGYPRHPVHMAKPAMFDARAFTMPEADVPNNFIWRQRDWERNSIQMLARAHFSQAECHGKNVQELHDMLFTQKGVNWIKFEPQLKYGTFVEADGEFTHNRETWQSLWERTHVGI